MKANGNTESTKTRVSTLPNVRISAENFGPIVNGSVDLRPLTVFVGPSNTGKTYLATLVYALHRILPDCLTASRYVSASSSFCAGPARHQNVN